MSKFQLVSFLDYCSKGGVGGWGAEAVAAAKAEADRVAAKAAAKAESDRVAGGRWPRRREAARLAAGQASERAAEEAGPAHVRSVAVPVR